MKKFSVFFLLISSLSILKPLSAPAQTKSSESSFSQELNQAITTAEKGDVYKTYKLFDALLKKHPDEILVYDAYATIAENYGNERRALQICKQWVAAHGVKSSSAIPIADRMAGLEKRIANEKLMELAPPWTEAKVSGNQIFIFTTNVPEPYASEKAKDIIDSMETSKRILEKIFGYSVPEKPLKVYLAARGEEYWNLVKEKVHENGISSAALYIPKKQEIIISSIAMDKAVVAHELTHHLIQGYLKNPSIFINEGLASYVEMKAGKEAQKVQLLNYLETLNYLYDQGEWEHFLDVTKAWKSFLQHRRMFSKSQGVQRNNYYTLFYMAAWVTTHFFVETPDPFYQKLFRDYLNEEKRRDSNDWKSFLKYFSSHLTKAQLDELDNAWGRHTLSLTYEKA